MLMVGETRSLPGINADVSTRTAEMTYCNFFPNLRGPDFVGNAIYIFTTQKRTVVKKLRFYKKFPSRYTMFYLFRTLNSGCIESFTLQQLRDLHIEKIDK